VLSEHLILLISCIFNPKVACVIAKHPVVLVRLSSPDWTSADVVALIFSLLCLLLQNYVISAVYPLFVHVDILWVIIVICARGSRVKVGYLVHGVCIQALVYSIEVDLITVVRIIWVTSTSHVVDADLIVESLRKIVGHEVVKHVVLAGALLGSEFVFV
jgi:hypothetical protein